MLRGDGPLLIIARPVLWGAIGKNTPLVGGQVRFSPATAPSSMFQWLGPGSFVMAAIGV